MCHTVRTTLACAPASVAEARHWMAAELASMFDDLPVNTADDVSLVVSELVTNCVRAEAHRFSLQIDGHHDEIVVATTDDAPGEPVVVHAGTAAPTGRGLMIVDAISDAWGVAPGVSEKTVWARFAIAAGTRAGFDCRH